MPLPDSPEPDPPPPMEPPLGHTAFRPLDPVLGPNSPTRSSPYEPLEITPALPDPAPTAPLPASIRPSSPKTLLHRDVSNPNTDPNRRRAHSFSTTLPSDGITKTASSAHQCNFITIRPPSAAILAARSTSTVNSTAGTPAHPTPVGQTPPPIYAGQHHHRSDTSSEEDEIIFKRSKNREFASKTLPTAPQNSIASTFPPSSGSKDLFKDPFQYEEEPSSPPVSNRHWRAIKPAVQSTSAVPTAPLVSKSLASSAKTSKPAQTRHHSLSSSSDITVSSASENRNKSHDSSSSSSSESPAATPESSSTSSPELTPTPVNKPKKQYAVRTPGSKNSQVDKTRGNLPRRPNYGPGSQNQDTDAMDDDRLNSDADYVSQSRPSTQQKKPNLPVMPAPKKSYASVTSGTVTTRSAATSAPEAQTDLSNQYDARVMRSGGSVWVNPNLKSATKSQQSRSQSQTKPISQSQTNSSLAQQMGQQAQQHRATRSQAFNIAATVAGLAAVVVPAAPAAPKSAAPKPAAPKPAAPNVKGKAAAKSKRNTSRTQPEELPAAPALPVVGSFKCPGCVLITNVQPATYNTEDDMFLHFLDIHCFDGISCFSDEQLRAMNFDVCDSCHIVFKNGLVHRKTDCRKPRQRPNALGVKPTDRSRLFREGFLTFDFTSVQINTETLNNSELFNERAPTLDYMPGNESLHHEFRLIFITLIKALKGKSPVDAAPIWHTLFGLPRLLLSIPASKDKTKQNTAAIVSDRINRFLGGHFLELVNESREHSISLKRSGRVFASNADATAHQVTTILKTSGDISRASRRLHSNCTVADIKEPGVLEAVSTLLGAGDSDELPENMPCDVFNNDCPQFEKGTVRVALSKSNKSASGVTGWHISHFNAIAKTDDGLRALTYFLNRIYADQLPPYLSQGLQNGILITLTKPKGGFRPIIISDAIIRLIGKCVVTLEQKHISTRLAPLQTAVNVQSGAEIIIHGIRSHLESHKTHIAIAVDFRNAFGTIKRDCISRAINVYDYDSTKYTRFFYNGFGKDYSSVIIGGPDEPPLTYANGVPQGGPLSMLWFCLAMQQLLVDTNNVLAPYGGKIMAYADDVFILADPDKAFHAFEHLLDRGPVYGLAPQPHKCKVLVTNDDLFEVSTRLSASHNFEVKPSQAIEILGTPVGTVAAERAFADQIDVSLSFEALSWIKDFQCSTILLRYCLASQLQYLTRTLPPDSSVHVATLVDQLVKEAICSLLGEEDIDDEVWSEACLPLSLGGLGIKKLLDNTHPDYFASASISLLHWRNTLGSSDVMIRHLCDGKTRVSGVLLESLKFCHDASTKFFASQIIPTADDPANPEKDLPKIKPPKLPKTLKALFNNPTPNEVKLQSQLYQVCARNTFRERWSSLTTQATHRIQMLAKTTGTPQIALQAMPTEPGLTMSNIETRLMLRQYLGLPLEKSLGLPNSHVRCHCESSYPKEKNLCAGNHLFNCHPSTLLTRRHNEIVEVVAEAFKSVNIIPERERQVSSVPEVSADGRRRPTKRYDLVAEPCDGTSKVLCMDISVASHTFINHLPQARCKPLFNANSAHTKKHTKYRQHIEPSTEVMTPLILETSGAIHYGVHRLFEHIGLRANGESPLQASWSAPTFSAYWLQRTSVVLWRENAHILLRIARESAKSKGYTWKVPILTTQTIARPQLLVDAEGQDLSNCA